MICGLRLRVKVIADSKRDVKNVKVAKIIIPMDLDALELVEGKNKNE